VAIPFGIIDCARTSGFNETSENRHQVKNILFISFALGLN